MDRRIVASLIFVFVMVMMSCHAQQVYLDTFGKKIRESKPVKIGGGVSASTVFYEGNDGQSRQPFTYFLNGIVNVNLFSQINLPFSFNITNLGKQFYYPTLPNRLSVHPVYKWITGHIGDVSMSFSPYTLNGHMFRGVGVDLTPQGPFKISAMGGRLQRAVEYSPENPRIPAAYARTGYGAKVRYDKSDYYAGMSFFSARDDVNSLRWKPDSLNIFPKSNVAVSLEGAVKLLSNLHLSAEYGLSMMARDVRSPREGSSFFDNAVGIRTSTAVYHALRADLNYQLQKNTIGIGYERIDPEYTSLGAYYFNNDYENLTLKLARPLFQDKVTVALNWGVQRDNLDGQNEETSKRLVSAATIDYRPSERLTSSFSYSSFQTYMHIRSQFDDINGQTPYDNLDTLNFTQLSQSMSLNINYIFGKNEKRKNNLNTNISFQEAANKQGDIIKPGNLTQFYTFSTTYDLMFVPEAMSLQAGFNATYNYTSGDDFIIMGPTIGYRAKIFKKKITTGISTSYNISKNTQGTQSKIFNLRWNAAYTFLKRHNVTTNAIWQHRYLFDRGIKESFTVTVGYAYSF
jgi:hypothetical protein